MNSSRLPILVFAVGVVVAGLLLKAARYMEAKASTMDAAIVRISAVMTARGWSLVGPAESRGGLYEKVEFASAHCPSPVSVAILGGMAESAELVRQDFGGDVAFIMAGQVLAAPSAYLRQMEILTHGLKRAAGLHAEPLNPVLAISPVPPEGESDCRGPAKTDWQ